MQKKNEDYSRQYGCTQYRHTSGIECNKENKTKTTIVHVYIAVRGKQTNLAKLKIGAEKDEIKRNKLKCEHAKIALKIKILDFRFRIARGARLHLNPIRSTLEIQTARQRLKQNRTKQQSGVPNKHIHIVCYATNCKMH